ncbi:alpha/beta hydrolase [Verminephrobacter aporrectodeae subsp. tuberculatae]|uniref:Alpha/beta hydrolase n=1 Tax=Verminephrobacter aporrectodeae subsp. tuberculatae TaxID=1110392 RepID=A0ABT3KXN1_9BURK|nr:alpha/beta hydrolase [Verminephrobacter aporrectodeae]MCW5323094.1 alpha/beta hydrolase [Verminephrobacter aporrectodeae subsp. tuberculatae]
MRSCWFWLVLLPTALLGGCAASPAPAPAAASPNAFLAHPLPGDGAALLPALQRKERVAPLRYRVIVLPGSGCAGMGAFAERYFAGLLHAQVLLLHKPGVAPEARTAPADCPHDFLRQDRLSAWLAHARAALRADARQRQGQPALPQLLVGISEGAELLPALAPEVPHLAGLILLSSSGLDPQESGALQARRLGREAEWQALGRARATALPDDALIQGRSLGYWRDLWHWPVAQPLTDGPWPVLQVWGADDSRVPAAAYERFAQRAARRPAALCAHRLDGADHGLQQPAADTDGVQQLWAWTEQWARAPRAGLCHPLQRRQASQETLDTF